MKTLVLFTLFTWASSVPLGWSPIGNWHAIPSVPLSNQWPLNNPSPAQVASHEIAQQIKLAEIENANLLQSPRSWWSDDVNILAQQAAQQVLKEAVEARQGQAVEGIVDIEKQLQQNVLGVPQPVEQVVAAKAINELNKELQMLELAKEKILPTTLLSQSLEAAIAAQLVSDNVAIGNGQSISNVRQPSGVLASRVKQLIDQTNIEEIKMEIINQQIIIKQLLQQKQFISQQLQIILAELVILQQQGASLVQLQQMQQVQRQLQQQEKQIVVSILARQQVIQQLEQALVEQQLNLQQNVKAEQVQQIQRWSAGPWLQRVGQTEPVWGPWSTVGNMWPQGNWIN